MNNKIRATITMSVLGLTATLLSQPSLAANLALTKTAPTPLATVIDASAPAADPLTAYVKGFNLKPNQFLPSYSNARALRENTFRIVYHHQEGTSIIWEEFVFVGDMNTVGGGASYFQDPLLNVFATTSLSKIQAMGIRCKENALMTSVSAGVVRNTYQIGMLSQNPPCIIDQVVLTNN